MEAVLRAWAAAAAGCANSGCVRSSLTSAFVSIVLFVACPLVHEVKQRDYGRAVQDKKDQMSRWLLVFRVMVWHEWFGEKSRLGYGTEV